MNNQVVYCIRSMTIAGGKERAVSKIANLLADQYDVGIWSLSNTPKSFYALDSRIRHSVLDAMSFLGLPRLKACLHFCQSVRMLVRFIRQERPTILVGTDFVVNILLLLARFVSGARVTIIGWEHLPLEEPLIANRKWLKKVRDFFYKRLDQLVVLTETDLAYCRKQHIRGCVIANPRSFAFEGTVDYEQKNILTIARLSYQKGLDIYLKVIASIKDKLEGWQFILVTKEDDISLASFEKELVRYQLRDHVQICSPRVDVLKYYEQASIYLMTSRYEGLPITLIEAQTCGLPCVSFDCKTGPADIISDGENGYLIPAYAIEQMAERLLQLMARSALRKQMGAAAKTASKRFDERHIVNLWQNLLKSTRGYSKFAS